MTNEIRRREPAPSIPALTLALLLFFVAVSVVVNFLADFVPRLFDEGGRLVAIAFAAH
jgi:hypothetical protein